MLAVKQKHPNLDIRFLFDKDNRLYRKSALRYSDWCKKNKFLFAIGTIPEEWFK